LIEDGIGWQESGAGSSRRHLDATINWLCQAQDIAGGAGVSAGFSFLYGWHPPYPETTGYIIPTFYDYANLTGREEILDRARRMADWEVEIQLPSGAVQGSVYLGPQRAREPEVFNTGQVILGWCRAFTETRDERYLNAARRAGDWLVQVQFPDGSWRLNGPEAETMVHAYDVRTAWSLLELDSLVRDGRYTQSATFNLDWTMAQQQENGWFRHNAFFTAGNWNLPLTHTISYVLEGLVESERITGHRQYLQAAIKTAARLLEIFETQKFMPGEFDNSWQFASRYSCLTGNAQIAGVWLRLFELTQDKRYLDGAIKLNQSVKATQRLRSLHPGVRGGVKGSQPISGRYTPYTYINWGAKFLADSLMLEDRILAGLKQGSPDRQPQAVETFNRPAARAISQ
jgi:uncharacterized protein YyaL (SSP411 family)